MRDKDQMFIFNDEEISLIKNTFSENDTLLYTVRKVLLQFPLTDTEKGLIKLSITPEVWRVLKKKILPEISEEFPFGQLPSLLTTLGNDLRVRNADDMSPLFEAKQLEIAYLEQQFEALKDVDAPEGKLKLTDFGVITGETLKTYAGVTAYLFILGYIDPMLIQIKSIAGQKTETVEQAKERMNRDSTQ